MNVAAWAEMCEIAGELGTGVDCACACTANVFQWIEQLKVYTIYYKTYILYNI